MWDEHIRDTKSEILSIIKPKGRKEESSMNRKEHHVVPNKNGGWDVKRDNALRASVHTETQKEAIQLGRAISRNQGTELVIHGKDSKILNSDSHGHDPCPPRDRK